MRPALRFPTATALFLGGVAALVSVTGCGGSTAAQPPVGATVPVQGVVTYKGKPLTQGTVVFEPDSGRDAQGEIQADGSFVLSTFQKDDGALPGVHRVSVAGVPKNVLPLKYRSAAAVNLEIEVSNGRTDYSVDLK